MTLVGENIKRLRSAAGLSQYDLSKKLDVHPAAISGWERGTRQPDLDMIKKIAGVFNVSTDFILGAERFENGLSALPSDLQVLFRSADWSTLSDDERRIITAVIKTVTEQHQKEKDSE